VAGRRVDKREIIMMEDVGDGGRGDIGRGGHRVQRDNGEGARSVARQRPLVAVPGRGIGRASSLRVCERRFKQYRRTRAARALD